MSKAHWPHYTSLIPHSSFLIPCLCLLIAGCRVGRGPDSASEAGKSPAVRFTDVTTAVGINFRHVNGAEGKKYMPETMGSGCAFLDYDNDGWQDILLINGEPWEGMRDEGRGTRPA